ncbi:RfaH, transcriptional activator RfaH [uncultured Caudovirales phage]|uniref:RfaH, transcriptional activator RfaH n=1 Tax=uncultured Caudovirales phage TaxID=2100421 RepID=A0A6J5MAV8_9CAUD|nr:RfaH, transcriptional activator RfaH [uncultured Caudovirales phage]
MSVARRKAAPRWFICRVFPARQMEFIDHCVRFGVSAYTPFRKVEVKPRHKRKPVRDARPAFPGYVFVAEGTVRKAMFTAPGYSRFVVFDGDIASVTNQVIEDLRAMELEWDKAGPAEPGDRPRFGLGDRVKMRGLFDGYDATVRRITRNSIHVEMDIRPGTLVDLPPDMVYPI